ncbi:MAG: hypothetical protein FJY80_06945 [Candidatus Aminicenantes bacterium]|nr:hypothetical protein [Candidatus Aminicenantes bacterium]
MRPAGMTSLERLSRSKLKPLISWQEFLRATPTLRKQVCGKPGCHCESGQKHLTLVLTRSTDGKVEQLYVPKDQEETVRLWVRRYREILDLLEIISSSYWDRLKKAKKER